MLELNKKGDKELEKMLAESRNSLRSFRFSTSGGKTRNVKEGRDLRKNIARVLTEMRKREMALMNYKISARGGSQPKADQPLAGAKSSG